MHTAIAAGVRRRTKLALLAAVLPAALAVPAGADAATVSLDSAGTVKFRAASGEVNGVTIALEGTGLLIRDRAGNLTGSGQCSRRSGTEVFCAGAPVNIRRVDVRLGNRDDSISSRTSLETLIDGGLDNDMFFAGMAPSTSRVQYRGDAGTDTVTYASATSGVSMTQNEVANDGRSARGDRDNVRRDVENFIGSPFADFLGGSPTGLVFCAEGCRGSTSFQRFSGGAGDDVIIGGRNGDIHFMGGGADGADRISPGGSHTIVDYSGRGFGVNVTVAQGTRNDGAPGEGDDILAGVDQLIGGRGNDVLTAQRSAAGMSLDGGSGNDTLSGSDDREALTGGPGSDTLLAFGGNDFVFANDGEGDTVGCGLGTDTAQLDSRDGFSSCENRPVGVLRLAPKAVNAEAGKPARLRLSWRHPQAWRKLRKVELRLYADRAPVGEVTIRPRGERINADGVVKVVRRGTRLTRRGKTVSARLALRIDASMAGQRLGLEVEATDKQGRRQLERNAGTIRVAK